MKKLFPLLAMVIVLSLVLTACSGGGPTTDLAKTWAPKLEGKIASVKVAARKPKS